MAGSEIIILIGAAIALGCFVIPGAPCNVWLTSEGAKNQAAQNKLFPQVDPTGRSAFPKSIPSTPAAQSKALFPTLNNNLPLTLA